MGSSREICTNPLPTPDEIGYFKSRLIVWHSQHSGNYPWRKSSATSYEKIVAEILLQRTRAETVAKFFPDFISCFPSWQRLSAADSGQLEACLRPLGLWRQRSRSLKRLADEMVARDGKFPADYEELRGLPCIGQYIANAICLFYSSEPRPLLDVNMARVLERYFGPRMMSDIRYDPYLQNLARDLIADVDSPIDMNFAVIDFARMVCKHRTPSCDSCPLASKCRYAKKSGRLSNA